MATYFWVGGAGTWDSTTTTNWSLTSGGLGGLGVPNNTDTANFDANSGTGTVSVDATAVSLSTTFNSANINLSLTGSPTICTAAGIFTFTQGTLTLNTFTLSCGRFNSTNANIRTIAFGTGNITLTANSTTLWTTATATNFTVTGTPVINATYSGAVGTRVFTIGNAGETNAISLNVTAGTDIVQLGTTSGSYRNINFTGFSGSATVNNAINVFGNLTISTGMTVNAGTSAITFAATSGTQQITTNGKTLDFPLTQNNPGATVQLQDNLTMGSTRTYTLTAGALDLSSGNRTLNTGLFASNNANTRSIAFGTGTIDLTGNNGRILDLRNVTNLTTTGTPVVNATYAGSTGTRTIETGALPEAEAISVNITAGTDIVTSSSTQARFKNLNFTGFTGTFNENNSQVIYGNLTLGAGMTVGASTVTLGFIGSATSQSITTNGVSVDRSLSFNGIGTTFSFQDALTQGSTRNFTIVNGTVQLKNGVTSTVGVFGTTGTNQKFLRSTLAGSQATLSQASGTVDASYLTIQDINATGGATWNAFVNQQNIDAGNNDGWDFGISPIVGSYEYTYQLRSFTQPRRF
jgi:hypothetical protein